jgi:uncharacterized protein YggT (Ycf19 family)
MIRLIIYYIAQIIIYALLARAVLSWFVNPYKLGYQHPLVRFYGMLCQLTEPLLKPARMLLARFNTGPLDLSLFVTMLFVYILERLLLRLPI